MKAFLVAAAIFGALDAMWLGMVANKFYKSQIGFILADKPNMVAAIIFYVIFIIGLVVFVINPADSAVKALGLGALFGLVTYATYDLTNQATLAKWPISVTIVDLIWGITASAIVAFATKYIITNVI